MLKTAITIKPPPGIIYASEKKFKGLNIRELLNLPKKSSRPKSLQYMILII